MNEKLFGLKDGSQILLGDITGIIYERSFKLHDGDVVLPRVSVERALKTNVSVPFDSDEEALKYITFLAAERGKSPIPKKIK